MLTWARNQSPPAPWGVEVTAAAVDAPDVETLKWLRAQDPPCPWDTSSCDTAACRANLQLLQWLRARGCPFGSSTAAMAAACSNVPMLKWLQSVGCPPCDGCMQAACHGDLATLEWLCDQGCQLTGELYHLAACSYNTLMLGFLYRKKVPLPAPEEAGLWCLRFSLPILMFLADIGMKLPADRMQHVEEARRAHCTFYGLIRWCRKAISDPSRGSHRAFDSMAEDRTGQLLLTRLCMLPPELISKIAISANLQHDICHLPCRGMQQS